MDSTPSIRTWEFIYSHPASQNRLEMSIVILIDPDKKVRPENAVRADVAWKLYLPEKMGDVSFSERKGLTKFTHWLWWELSDRLGFMRKGAEEVTYIITPLLTESAKELMTRICSMWSDEVFAVNAPNEGTDLRDAGQNLWKAPVVNVESEGGPLMESMTQDHHDSVTTFFMPALGSAKSFMRTYRIKKGSSYSRLHSHSAVEEHYLVLEGKGSLRYGRRHVAVKKGDMISKPVGPDNFSQFIADADDDMKILDIEVWPDTTMNAKDTVLYPDHREVFMRGQAWSAIIQADELMGADDFQKNYDTGYVRERDGSWTPERFPGFDERKPD